MPRSTTMDRLARLDLLVSRLTAEEPLTVGGVAREVGVSRRTVFRDIAILRERGVPIEADAGRGGGIRLERRWGVGRLALSYREAVELLVSLAIAEQMQAPWLIANLSPIRRKLAASFAPALRGRIAGLAGRIRVGRSASPAVLGTLGATDAASAEALCRAFLEMRLMSFGYSDTEGNTSRRRVEPHHLMLNYPVWYLVAWDTGRGAVRSFRLDRMQRGRVLEAEFRPRPVADFAEAFAGIAAVTP